VAGVTGDDLVAAELARCIHRAASSAGGMGLAAMIRVHAIRALPVDMAAQLLRQEAADALNREPGTWESDRIFEWLISHEVPAISARRSLASLTTFPLPDEGADTGQAAEADEAADDEGPEHGS
jgi:hypothetical protein